MYWIIGTAIYLALFAIVYGATFAYYQRRFASIAKEDYYEDKQFAIRMAIFAPVTVIPCLLYTCCAYGFKFR